MNGNIIIDLIIIAVTILRRKLELILLKFISTELQPIYSNIRKNIYYRQNITVDWEFYIADFQNIFNNNFNFQAEY
jgi:hypothetical protein